MASAAVWLLAGAAAWLPVELEDPATGSRVELSAGAPALHVVLFATWCPPCVDELEELAELEARWGEHGYRLILVAVSTRHTPSKLARFAEQRRTPGRLLLDADGLLDGAETNTGVYVSPDDTGTHPLVPDTDDDGLLDGVETNTGIFVDANDTGSDPHLTDSDGDGYDDGEEVAGGSNPNNPLSFPIAVPGLSPLGMVLCGLVLLLAYGLVLRRGVIA